MPKVSCRWPRPVPSTKRCASCKKDKPYTREFWGPDKRSSSGLSDGWCRRCITEYSKIRNREERLNALIAYGNGTPDCACCGDGRYEFLTLDHINGGGNQHRLAVTGSKKGGAGVFRWLRLNNYPPGFQVLCYNCNMGRAANGGKCPYATEHAYERNASRRRRA